MNPPADLQYGRPAAELARFEALIEAVPLAIAIFDAELTLVTSNARYRELTGLDAAGAQRRSIYDAFPNALADLADQIDGAAEGTPGALAAARVPFQHPSGERLVEARFTPLTNEFGGRGLLFTGNDVTEREELRESLARSVAQLESIFDVIPDSVRVLDHTGRTLRSNTQAQQDHTAARASTLHELWQSDRPRRLDGTSLFVHEHPTARALQGERVRGETLEVRRGSQGDTAVIEVNSNPLADERGRVRGAVTVERDVTERTLLARKLEEEARRTAELYERVSTEAERLERMVQERTRELLALQEARARERRLAAVGQLAAGVMHDVNNALNPIMAAAYLLEAKADDPAAVRDYAVRIAKAAETGAATAARVGRFIRQEPLKGDQEEAVDLSAVAEEVVAMTRPLWAERARGGVVQFESDLVPGAYIRGITGELREAMLNLVQNALDAMHGGGKLAISTRLAAETVSIEVRDSGMGMSAEVRDRAFEPFFTTKGQKGTGLGLSEVYGIVKRHRGRAEIESLPQVGTTVRLVFPFASPVDEQPQEAPPRRRAQVSRQILLVEDHDDGRDFMRALLESDGHAVDAVGSMQDAISRLGANGSGPYDVMVTDIGLPDGSGWELIGYARKLWPTMRIGVVTGWEPRSPGVECDFTLRKPVRTAELLALVAGDED